MEGSSKPQLRQASNKLQPVAVEIQIVTGTHSRNKSEAGCNMRPRQSNNNYNTQVR